MTARSKSSPGRTAVDAMGWLAAHKWLVLRRLAQAGFLALFLSGPVAGIWLVKGTLASSLTLQTLPLSDPLILLQSFLAGHAVAATALIGAAIVAAGYLVVGGRAYCAWVCPVNPVTDAAHWLRERIGLPKGWQPSRNARLWLLAAVLVASAATGSIAWEIVNPVTVLHRGLVFGTWFAGGIGWALILAVFLFDLAVSRRGWCGHICPVGAFYGLIGRASLVRVATPRRADCNDCMDCYAVCPEPHILTLPLKGGPESTPVILSGDCTNCGRCIDVCSRDVFRFGWRFDGRQAPASREKPPALREPEEVKP